MGPRGAAVSVTLLSSLAFFAVGMNVIDFGIVQGPAVSELHMSISDSGLLVQAFFITYALMQVPGGFLADRWGGEKTIAVFSAITGVAAIGLGVSNSFSVALVSRLAIGLGCGPLLPASVRSMSKRMQGRQYELATGFFSAGWGFSQLVALNLLPVLEVGSGWRTALVATSVLTFGVAAAAVVVAVVAGRTGGVPGETPRVRIGETLSRKTILLVLINVTGIVVPVATLTWIPTRFQSLFQMTPVDVGRLLSILGGLTVVSAILGGFATRVLGRGGTIVGSMLFLAVSTALLANPPNLVAGLLLSGLLGFSSQLYASPTYALVSEVAPAGKQNPGLVFGVFNTFCNALAFFPPLAAALILDYTRDFTYAFFSITAVAVAGLLCALLLRSGTKRR